MTSSELSTPRNTIKKGLFIVFEGIDRAGKTTQCSLLAAKLRANKNLDVVEMRFPNYTTPCGELLSQYLKSKVEIDARAAHLLFCANRWEQAKKINELLEEGKVIVCDRFSASGVAYSMAKGVDMAWCISCEQGLPRPDLVVLLNVEPELASTRANFGIDDRHEVLALQQKIAANYYDSEVISMAQAYRTIDGSSAPEHVALQTYELVCKVLIDK